MAGNSKDSKILAYKDMINQLNKTISAQTELIQSLQKTLEADRLEKENLRQQIEYLTKKLSENAIRPFTVGRKNWLFSASPKGATASAIVYTMVEMAKANELNTYKYLTYLLSQRPNDKMSDEQLEQLAPWSETAKANCQN